MVVVPLGDVLRFFRLAILQLSGTEYLRLKDLVCRAAQGLWLTGGWTSQGAETLRNVSSVKKILLFITCFVSSFFIFKHTDQVKNLIYSFSLVVDNYIGGADSEGSWNELILVLIFLLAISTGLYAVLSRLLFSPKA
ncbi:Uncharacterised protein [Yersinia aldovae]|nr:Uncharacterised protein [Yersinia aldovae]